MAEFNDDKYSGYPRITDEKCTSVDELPPPTLPQVARLDRALAVLPLLVLAIVLVLLLAGCSADPNGGNRTSIRAQRDRQYSQLATADVAPTMPALRHPSVCFYLVAAVMTTGVCALINWALGSPLNSENFWRCIALVCIVLFGPRVARLWEARQ